MVAGEMIFYCGIAGLAASVVMGIAAFILFKIRFSTLNRRLEQEYGKREKKRAEPVQSRSDG